MIEKNASATMNSENADAASKMVLVSYFSNRGQIAPLPLSLSSMKAVPTRFDATPRTRKKVRYFERKIAAAERPRNGTRSVKWCAQQAAMEATDTPPVAATHPPLFLSLTKSPTCIPNPIRSGSMRYQREANCSMAWAGDCRMERNEK